MTLDFFLKTYDFNELEIVNMEIDKFKLKIEVIMEAHLDYIANGYRPELDMKTKKMFIFEDTNIQKLTFEKPFIIEIIKYDENSLIINICNNDIIIKGKSIEIISLD